MPAKSKWALLGSILIFLYSSVAMPAPWAGSPHDWETVKKLLEGRHFEGYLNNRLLYVKGTILKLIRIISLRVEYADMKFDPRTVTPVPSTIELKVWKFDNCEDSVYHFKKDVQTKVTRTVTIEVSDSVTSTTDTKIDVGFALDQFNIGVSSGKTREMSLKNSLTEVFTTEQTVTSPEDQDVPKWTTLYIRAVTTKGRAKMMGTGTLVLGGDIEVKVRWSAAPLGKPPSPEFVVPRTITSFDELFPEPKDKVLTITGEIHGDKSESTDFQIVEVPITDHQSKACRIQHQLHLLSPEEGERVSAQIFSPAI